MRIRTLHHVGLEVDDLDEAVHFYGEILGLPVRGDRPAELPAGVWLDAGDRRVNLAPRGQSESGPHVALVVDDLETVVAELQAKGVEISELTAPLLNAMVRDPWGNWIELRQPPEVWAAHFATAAAESGDQG